MPSLDNGAAIAAAAGVSLTWLATGEEPKYRGDAPKLPPQPCIPDYPEIDTKMVFRVLDMLDRANDGHGTDVVPGKMRGLVQLLCERIVEAERAAKVPNRQ